jgi:hypothetical protein
MDREVLRATCQKLCGLTVTWDHQREIHTPVMPVFAADTAFAPSVNVPQAGPILAGTAGQAKAVIRLHTVREQGTWNINTFNPNTGLIVPTTLLMYNAILSFEIKSYAGVSAMEYGEKILRRFYFPSITAELKANNMAYVEALGCINLQVIEDYLTVSSCGVDVVVTYTVAEDDFVDNGYMIKADLTGTIT